MAETTIGTLAAIATPDLDIIEGQVTTTSHQVAQHFGKQHKLVLRAIRNLLKELPAEHQHNFAPMLLDVEVGCGAVRKDPAYRITRDGFTLLAMGFTGKEAMQWKVAYLSAFNKMESELLTKVTRPHNPAIGYHRITQAQAQDLKELVQDIAAKKIQGFGETWNRLHRKFRVTGYKELPAIRFEEARDYLLGKLPPEAAAAQPDPAAVPTLMGRRWLIATTPDGQETVLPIAHSAMVVSAEDLPARIEQGDFFASDLLLARIASAVAAKQGQRAMFRERQLLSA